MTIFKGKIQVVELECGGAAMSCNMVKLTSVDVM